MLSTKVAAMLAVALCTSRAMHTQDGPKKCQQQKYRTQVHLTKDMIDACLFEAETAIAEYKRKIRGNRQAQATSTSTSVAQPSPSATKRTSCCASVMNFFRALCGAANKTRTE